MLFNSIFSSQSINKTQFSTLLKAFICLSPLFAFLDLILRNLFNFVFYRTVRFHFKIKNSVKHTAKTTLNYFNDIIKLNIQLSRVITMYNIKQHCIVTSSPL